MLNNYAIIEYAMGLTIFHDSRNIGRIRKLLYPKSEYFFDENVKKVFERGGKIIDIGGGLRMDKSRGDREEAGRKHKFEKYLSYPDVDYKITDYTDKYFPDYVEDIHNLSFENNSIDGIFCIAVLEHVYNPQKAVSEIIRVLKKGGLAFIYMPFIYRYHAHDKEYKDYFRYSKDGIEYLFRDCSSVEICPVRGLFETLLKITPLSKISALNFIARIIDNSSERMRRASEKQTSGHHILIRK